MMRTSARRVRSLADAFVIFFLQNAQQFALQFQRHFTDFVQKKRSAFRRLETSGAIFNRSSERAARVAEKFAFIQIFWNGGAVDADKRLVFALAAPMDFVRDQFLAGAGFTENQHGRIGRRDQINLAHHLPQRRALANQIAERFGLDDFFFQQRRFVAPIRALSFWISSNARAFEMAAPI